MEFKWHIFIGFVVSYILVYFYNFSLLSGIIIFLSSWMIDGDHYFWHGFETKNWSPIHALKWYKKYAPKWFDLSTEERNKFKRGVFFCHGILFWVILIALSFVHEIFLWVLIGVGIHMIADGIDLYLEGEPLYNKMLPCYIIRRNKNKKRYG